MRYVSTSIRIRNTIGVWRTMERGEHVYPSHEWRRRLARGRRSHLDATGGRDICKRLQGDMQHLPAASRITASIATSRTASDAGSQL